MKWAGESHLERVRVAENSLLPDEITRREYGYTVAAAKETPEYLMPPMERSTLPRRIPCSNNKEGIDGR